MNDLQRAKLSAAFGHRLTAMLESGYLLVHMYMGEPTQFYKLRHDSNGNEVTFAITLSKNHMVQKRNGRVVYEGTIQP